LDHFLALVDINFKIILNTSFQSLSEAIEIRVLKKSVNCSNAHIPSKPYTITGIKLSEMYNEHKNTIVELIMYGKPCPSYQSKLRLAK